MIFNVAVSLHRKTECGFEGKCILQTVTGASSAEEAKRHMLANNADLTEAVLDGWALCNLAAFEVQPESLLKDNDLIKAFLVEMARRPKEGDDGS